MFERRRGKVRDEFPGGTDMLRCSATRHNTDWKVLTERHSASIFRVKQEAVCSFIRAVIIYLTTDIWIQQCMTGRKHKVVLSIDGKVYQINIGETENNDTKLILSTGGSFWWHRFVYYWFILHFFIPKKGFNTSGYRAWNGSLSIK